MSGRERRRRRGDGGAGAELDPVGPHRPLDVLEPLLAEGREAAVELALEVVVGGARDHDPARLGELLEPGGDVDAVAVEVAVVLADHVAEVDADAEADALLLGHLRLALRHAALDRDRAGDRVDDARELAERAVAHELDDAAAVLGDERLDQLLAVRLEPGERAGPRRAP